MKRRNQTLQEILDRLSPVETDWQDDFSRVVVQLLQGFPERDHYGAGDLHQFLEAAADAGQFQEALTVFQLFLGLSKDEFRDRLRQVSDGRGTGVTAFRRDANSYVDSLV